MDGTTFKLATWNVNSIRIRMELLKNLRHRKIRTLSAFRKSRPRKKTFRLKTCGLSVIRILRCTAWPATTACAFFPKTPLKDVEQKNWVGKTDARHICARVFDDIEINNIYIPAGGDIPDPIANLSFAHKLTFMDDVAEWWEQHQKTYAGRKMIVCGDFNVAPLENDVWNHRQMLKIVSHTPVEIERLTRLKNSLNFVDVLRKFHPEPEKAYSWWSYRNPNWQTNNKGRRLDHIWTTPNLEDRLVAVKILKEARNWERPSDHVPVIAEIKR